MKKIAAFLSATIMLGLAGCSAAKLTPLASPDSPTVFFSKTPNRPYNEIAYVESTGSIFTSRQALLRQLQKRQTGVQGDALVQLRYDYQFWWPHASAVVVKYN